MPGHHLQAIVCRQKQSLLAYQLSASWLPCYPLAVLWPYLPPFVGCILQGSRSCHTHPPAATRMRWSLQSESKNEGYETQQRAHAASAPAARTPDEPARDGEPCPALLRRTREGGLCQIHLRPSFMDGDRDYGSRAASLGRLGCCPRTRHRFRLRQHDWRCTRARAGNGRFVLVPICGR